MESRFFVEAKAFSFLVEIGKPELRVEERKKGFLGSIFLSPQECCLVDNDDGRGDVDR